MGVHVFTTNIQNGSDVTWGEHNITYKASDKAGNIADCNFVITVAGRYLMTLYLLFLYALQNDNLTSDVTK